MIPSELARPIHLRPRVLQRYPSIPHQPPHLRDLWTAKYPLSLYCPPIQFSPVAYPDPQFLHGRPHGVILPFQLHFVLLALRMIVQLRSAVDGPVTKRAETGELERARVERERVGEEVADES